LMELLKRLGKENKLIAPVKLEKDVEFAYVENVEDIIFDFGNTVKPAKDFFLPQSESILLFTKDQIRANIKKEKRVLFGIRTCDLYGLRAMDFVFKDTVEDNYYLEKRKNTIIIVYGCSNNCNDNAFCDSFFGHTAKDNFDIQVINIDKDNFFVEFGSDVGKSIIEKNISLFAKLNKEELYKVDKIKNTKINKKTLNKDLLFDNLNKKRFGHVDYWKEISKTCLRCGACTYLCPSCFCNNIFDNSESRIRRWDSCMFRGFTRQAGGFIPREDLFKRFRQRIYHKYKWHKDRYGIDMCTGCGRCISYCPGLIDYFRIIEEISNG